MKFFKNWNIGKHIALVLSFYAAVAAITNAVLFLVGSLLTLTTTTIDITEAFESLLKPLARNGKVVLEPEMIILPSDYKLEDHGPQVPLHHVWGGQ